MTTVESTNQQTQQGKNGAGDKPRPEKPEAEKLHIFVNRRKFGADDGVSETMTGSQIAGLVGVPAENAVVRYDTGADQREVGTDEPVKIQQADHFLVTRRTVEGGYVA